MSALCGTTQPLSFHLLCTDILEVNTFSTVQDDSDDELPTFDVFSPLGIEPDKWKGSIIKQIQCGGFQDLDCCNYFHLYRKRGLKVVERVEEVKQSSPIAGKLAVRK